MKQLAFRMLFLPLFLCGLPVEAFSQEVIDLSGVWRFAVDKNNVGITERWYAKILDDQIILPGSMPENLKGDLVSLQTHWTGSLYDSSYYFNPRMEKFRQEGNIKFPFFLTPDRHYVGVAWYQQTINIPDDWKGRNVQLFLERPHIETKVWVDNRLVGEEQYSLCVPHIYDLTSFLKKGEQVITIRVDNTIQDKYNPGIDSHSVTDQTQGNWNGIVGKIRLEARSRFYLSDIQAYPDVDRKEVRVKIAVVGPPRSKAKGVVSLSAGSFNSDKRHEVAPASKEVVLENGQAQVEVLLPMGDEALTWDEFDPALYRLKAQLRIKKDDDTKEITFGMRKFEIKGKWFYVNGRKTMLRGTVENCCFPQTGYAPMDVNAWLRIFNVCKSHGLNHMRFHSVCPPEAAFMAADMTGFYLQPEGPSWPNHGVRLGRGMAIDTFLMKETQALTKAYGNYASFCLLAAGNEPAGNWVPWVADFVRYWAETDSRRVYTGASVGNSWAWQPANQFHVKAGARGLSWGKTPESLSDYRQRIDTVRQPYVSHETGQWCVFPDFNEIKKYTGVNKAKNFELFKDLLAEGDMSDQATDFLMASGKLQALCYKHEIEKTLRTPDYAGFQLLSLNDYSGQGTALVGLLNVFWEEKPYSDARQFRRFCNTTVPLTRMERFVFKNSERFRAQVEIAHFGKEPLEDARVEWRVKDSRGTVCAKGAFPACTIPIGNGVEIGEISYALSDVTQATQFNLEVHLAGTAFANDWDFWVYPEKVLLDTGRVWMTDTLDEKAIHCLQQGGDVLILAAGKIKYGADIKQQLTPVFWNTSWFKMRPPHTTGLLINPSHPVFADFPTQYHSNVQWADLTNHTQVMQLTEFPEGFRPLVQNIHTWFISRKIGSLFEARVLNGRLMMTTMDLQTDLENRFVARQLLASILKYMNSPAFRPPMQLNVQQIETLFVKDSERINLFTKDAPDELKKVKR